MPILNITISQAGLVDVVPSQAYINTNDPISAVTTAGYLNKEVANGAIFNLPCLAIVATKTSPTSAAVAGTYNVVHSGDNWSLTPPSDNTDIPLASSHIFVGNASNVATDVAMTGDIGINNAGVTAIQAGVIVNTDINANAAIAFSKLAPLAPSQLIIGSAGSLPTATTVTGDITFNPSGVSKIQTGVITNIEINAAAGIAFSKLAALPSGDILVGSAGNVATAVALSGDATLSNAGALTIANSAITTNKVNKNLMQFFTGTLTAAQLRGMYAAPVLLLAAPGPNSLLVLDQFQLVMTYGTQNYAGGGAIAVQYDNTINGGGTASSMILSASEVNNAGASTTFTFIADADTPKPFSTSVTKGLYLSNVTGAFTTGDSNFTYFIWWREIPSV